VKIVIIGAGVAGLAIGWRLLQSGAEVTILERAQAGHGATWAAAGMIAATAELGEMQTPEAELGHRARGLWPDFAHAIEDASGLAIGYAQSGSLLVATTAEDAAGFAVRAAHDPDLAMLTEAEARAREPRLRDGIAGALWASQEARVDNRALGRALAAAFVRAGGTLVTNEAVIRVETMAGRAVAARTPFGHYEADAFVLAAGAWSGLVEGMPPVPIKPMKGEMLALSPPDGAALPRQMVWGNQVYLVPRGGQLLIGATLEDTGFDTSLTEAAADWLSSRALALMPVLRDWTIAEHWAGLRPASPDGLPLLGPSTIERLFIAGGQYRNGILFAPAVAEILCGLVLERPTDIRAFDPRRFAGSLAPSAALR